MAAAGIYWNRDCAGTSRVVTQEGAGHSERWWAERLPEALIFLFGENRERR
jgi:hypothetical protein